MIQDNSLDNDNHICSLVRECLALTKDTVLRNKLKTIKHKAQKMEKRLIEYRTTIESLGFERRKK